MAKTTDKLHVDPEHFAYAVMTATATNQEDPLATSKAALKQYLTAYYLAEKFNGLEAEHFDSTAAGWLKAIGSVEPIDWHTL